MLTLGGLATVAGIVLCLMIDWFPGQGADEAKQIDTLYDVLLIVSVPIFVLVMTVVIFSVWKWRAKPGDMSDGEPIHGNTLLEVIWVTIPTILVTGLAVYGWIVLDDIEDRKPDTLIVNVSGQQFAWSFRVPKQAGVPKQFATTELQLPRGRPVEFDIRSSDVIHSFWIPDFRLKSDAVPGLKTQIRVKPSELGPHDIVCAELCGLGHSTMRQTVRVVEPKAFEDWAGKQKGSGGSGEQAAVAPDTHTLADAASISKVGAVQ